MVLSMELNLKKLASQALKSNNQESKFKLVDLGFSNYDSNRRQHVSKTNWQLPLLIDKELDASGLEKWRTRYMRDAPVSIKPFRRNA